VIYAKNQFRFHAELQGMHIHARVFSGPDDGGVLHGTLIFTLREWDAFRAVFSLSLTEPPEKRLCGDDTRLIERFLLATPDFDTVWTVNIDNLTYDAVTCSGHMDAIETPHGDLLSFLQGDHHLVAIDVDAKELCRLENIVLVRWGSCPSVNRLVDCDFLVRLRRRAGTVR